VPSKPAPPLHIPQQRLTLTQLLRPRTTTKRHHPTAPAVHLRTPQVGGVPASSTQRASAPRTRVGHRVARDRADEQTLLEVIHLTKLIFSNDLRPTGLAGVYNPFSTVGISTGISAMSASSAAFCYGRLVLGDFLSFSSPLATDLFFFQDAGHAAECWLSSGFLSAFLLFRPLGSSYRARVFRHYMYYGRGKRIVYAVTGYITRRFFGGLNGSVRAYVCESAELGKNVCSTQMNSFTFQGGFFPDDIRL
jgi:hypothetical protein